MWRGFAGHGPWMVKARPRTGEAFANPRGAADPGVIGPGVGASAERRQKHDDASPPGLPSAVTSAQADRSCHDLAATARQSAGARMAARSYHSDYPRLAGQLTGIGFAVGLEQMIGRDTV